jgi:hypothetical protein
MIPVLPDEVGAPRDGTTSQPSVAVGSARGRDDHVRRALDAGVLLDLEVVLAPAALTRAFRDDCSCFHLASHTLASEPSA